MQKKTTQKTDNKQAEQLKKLGEELQSAKHQLARALADYQNLEKRAASEKDAWMQFAGKSILLAILPILDTLKRAERSTGQTGQTDGVNLAIKQFEQVLVELGVSPIPVAGQLFDPKVMECVEVVAGGGDNQVAEEVLTGYHYHGHLLRPARVKVFKKDINQKVEELAHEAAQTGDYA